MSSLLQLLLQQLPMLQQISLQQMSTFAKTTRTLPILPLHRRVAQSIPKAVATAAFAAGPVAITICQGITAGADAAATA